MKTNRKKPSSGQKLNKVSKEALESKLDAIFEKYEGQGAKDADPSNPKVLTAIKLFRAIKKFLPDAKIEDTIPFLEGVSVRYQQSHIEEDENSLPF